MSDIPLIELAGQRRLAPRRDAVNDELRRLLDAGLNLLRNDPRVVPRVGDIVAAGASSKDAFYRAFGSRDAFLAVIVDDGARRLLDYVAHRRSTVPGAAGRIEAALDALLRQAGDPEVAATTRAVLSCAPARRSADGVGIAALADRVAALLVADLEELGSPEPHRDALTLARAAIGEMEAQLWAGSAPGADERTYLRRLVTRMTDAGVKRAR